MIASDNVALIDCWNTNFLFSFNFLHLKLFPSLTPKSNAHYEKLTKKKKKKQINKYYFGALLHFPANLQQRGIVKDSNNLKVPKKKKILVKRAFKF